MITIPLSGLHTAIFCRPTCVGQLQKVGQLLRSHVKFEFANTKKLARIEASSICRQQFTNLFADCFCAVHTQQLEFDNTSLPTLVCRVKAALDTRHVVVVVMTFRISSQGVGPCLVRSAGSLPSTNEDILDFIVAFQWQHMVLATLSGLCEHMPLFEEL